MYIKTYQSQRYILYCKNDLLSICGKEKRCGSRFRTFFPKNQEDRSMNPTHRIRTYLSKDK